MKFKAKDYARFNASVKEKGGLVNLWLIYNQDIGFWRACFNGDETALMILRAVRDAIQTAPGTLCLMCDHKFGAEAPPAFMMLAPGVLDLTPEGVSMMSGICRKCCHGKSYDDLMREIIPRLRELKLDMRVLNVMDEPKGRQ